MISDECYFWVNFREGFQPIFGEKPHGISTTLRGACDGKEKRQKEEIN